MSTLADELQAYESSLRRWAAQPNSARRNATFLRNHSAFKGIRSTAEGQELILRLAADDHLAVAAVAATHALWFDPEPATRILAAIAKTDSEAGLSATWTLAEFSRGALNLDW
jgi:hypothetical protein